MSVRPFPSFNMMGERPTGSLRIRPLLLGLCRLEELWEKEDGSKVWRAAWGSHTLSKEWNGPSGPPPPSRDD